MLFSLLLSVLIAGTDPPQSSASESMIDSFIAALPPSDSPAAGSPSELDRQALERLEQENPGHEAEARRAFAAYRQCKLETKEKAVAEALRSTARRLGNDKLARLTAFYRGPDYALFGRLAARQESDLSESEKAEVERILAAYPLEDFFASSKKTEQEMWSFDGLLGQLMKCEEALEAELASQGLNS